MQFLGTWQKNKMEKIKHQIPVLKRSFYGLQPMNIFPKRSEESRQKY